MVNINGKPWNKLRAVDIKNIWIIQTVARIFSLSIKKTRKTLKNLRKKFRRLLIHTEDMFY